ncbi:uncharacterized protein [Panulirus ornatus]|uniref:uncharacterized protein n=1 Tax=Panulirus ornatus TaxID=150431 RepID=UPI003A85C25A
MPVLYCGQGNPGRAQHLQDGLDQVEASARVTYCLTPAGGAGPPGGLLPDTGGYNNKTHSPSPSLCASCCHYAGDCCCGFPTTALYAVLGLSRCWWNYTVTLSSARDNASDAMEEGVATESRGGSGAEVTGVGWSLPCSLSSLLAMNCRARAEGLARRLQSKVRIGNGGTSAFEQTSLVSPGPEDHYASMDCRHSSLDDPQMDLLDESKMRPIHVVTSEPTLHLCLPSPPTLGNVPEQDSDVYYDFDLASPDEAAEEEEEEELDGGEKDKEGQEDGQKQSEKHQGRRYDAGERPESGCVTSVTSPVMFDDDRDHLNEDIPPGQPGDLFPPEESRLCSPDADLRAVRQILSNSSLNEVPSPATESAGGNITCEDTGCVECDEILRERCAISACDCKSSACEWSNRQLGTSGGLTQVWASGMTPGSKVSGTEGAGGRVDNCTLPPMPVTSPVAKSGPDWCHIAQGTQPVAPLTSGDWSAGEATLTDSGESDSDDSDYDHTDSETCDVEYSVMIDNEGQNKGEEGHTDSRELEGVDGQGTDFVARVTVQYSSFEREEEPVPAGEHGQPDGVPQRVEEIILKPAPETATAPRAISGTTPPLTDPHLYTPSEGHPTVMEAREEDECDLQGKDEVFYMDSDTEEIETLRENEEESEDEGNEEDIEEETVLRGKFRNFRGYTERVRRLSDEVEDRTPSVKVLCYDGEPQEEEEEEEEEEAQANGQDDEEIFDDQVSSSELTTQLSELQVEDVGIQVDAEDDEVDPEAHSSSEEPDPERVDDFKMRIKRSSSLKCGKTPPGTPGRKKIVRFADMLGLDLAAVRTFLGGGVPHVPRSAFWDLQVEKEAAVISSGFSSMAAALAVPRRVLTPLFQQPGSQLNFLERVRNQRVVVENVEVGEDMSVRGIVRVLNLDFHKSVSVRYTFDHWRNFHEATATYVPGSYDGLTDRFSFLLWGSFLQDNGALVFCVRYQTLGQDFWDNNYGNDYVLQCYTTPGVPGEEGLGGTPRPQNTSCVQQHFSGGGPAASRAANYNSCFVGSPTTPSDPWITSFF